MSYVDFNISIENFILNYMLLVESLLGNNVMSARKGCGMKHMDRINEKCLLLE